MIAIVEVSPRIERDGTASTLDAAVRELRRTQKSSARPARNRELSPASRRDDLAAWQSTRDNEINPLVTTMFDRLTALDAAEDTDAAAPSWPSRRSAG